MHFSAEPRLSRLVKAARALLIVGAVALLGFTARSAATPSDAVVSDAAAVLSLTNTSRVEAGLAELVVDESVSAVAQVRAETMAAAGILAHDPGLGGLLTVAWTAIGENVGYAGDVTQLHEHFMASDGHRVNILGNYNAVGVGSTRDAAGLLWVAVVFVNTNGMLIPTAVLSPSAPAVASPAPASVEAAPAVEPVVVATGCHRSPLGRRGTGGWVCW